MKGRVVTLNALDALLLTKWRHVQQDERFEADGKKTIFFLCWWYSAKKGKGGRRRSIILWIFLLSLPSSVCYKILQSIIVVVLSKWERVRENACGSNKVVRTDWWWLWGSSSSHRYEPSFYIHAKGETIDEIVYKIHRYLTSCVDRVA